MNFILNILKNNMAADVEFNTIFKNDVAADVEASVLHRNRV